jgi:hypothetical protein
MSILHLCCHAGNFLVARLIMLRHYKRLLQRIKHEFLLQFFVEKHLKIFVAVVNLKMNHLAPY